MALAASTTDIAAAGAPGIRVIGIITATGNYTTGGDALDFRGKARLAYKDPKIVRISGQAGYSYSYDFTNRKMKVHTTAATELTGAPTAYPAGVTGDVIRYEAWFGK